MACALAVVADLASARLRDQPPALSAAESAARPLDAAAPAPAAAPASGDLAMPAVFARDGVLTVDGHRYAVGDADDHAVYTDFACDMSSVVVLRLPEGAAHFFDGLPRDDTPITGRRLSVVDRAAALELDVDDRGCARALVRRTDGTAVVVAPEHSTPEGRQ